jgi:4-hydroxy-2-oxoheptanedioate aldolase
MILRPNKVRERWERNEVALDIWMSGTSMTHIEAVGRLGFDSILLDMQHGPIDYRDVLSALVAIEACDISSIVRVPWNEPAVIMKVLDAGAQGVMCPVVNSRSDANAFVGAVRYPPLGYRSYGPMRVYGGSTREYFEKANESVLAVAQIESVEGLENLPEIVETPGLDMLFVGPSDLSISGGGPPGMDYTNEIAIEQHRKIVAVAHEAGLRVGMLAIDAQAIAAGLEWGMDFLSVGHELMLVVDAARRALTRGRDAAGQGPAASAQAESLSVY